MKTENSLKDLIGEESVLKLEALYEQGSTERRIAEDIIRYLDSIGALALEPQIMRSVPGKHCTKVAVFRSLIDFQFVHRIGEGRRNAPFQYCLNLRLVPDSLKSCDVVSATKRSKRTSPKATELQKVEAPKINWTDLLDEELEEITVLFRTLHDQALKLRRHKPS